MAFAAPRRPLTRTRDRKPSKDAAVGPRGYNILSEKMRNFMAIREREWLKKKSDGFTGSGSDHPSEKYKELRSFTKPSTTDIQNHPQKIHTTITKELEGKGDDCAAAENDYDGYLKTRINANVNNGLCKCSCNAFKSSRAINTMNSCSDNNNKNNLPKKEEELPDEKLKITGEAIKEPEAEDDYVSNLPMSRDDLHRKAEDVMTKAKSHLYRYGRISRPESHFCPVCKKLMSLPGHDPMCLIPCGHNMCEPCSKTVKNDRQCPFCEHDVQTATHNVLLQSIIDQFAKEHGTVNLTVAQKCQASAGKGVSDQGKPILHHSSVDDKNLQDQDPTKMPCETTKQTQGSDAAVSKYSKQEEDTLGASNYVPQESDLEKWAEQLAAVEMRLSVIDLQARQTAKAIVTAKTREHASKEALKALEMREKQMRENLRFTEMQLKETDADRRRILQQMSLDKANAEKHTEQLNLINYTKAGLEGELEKLRLFVKHT